MNKDVMLAKLIGIMQECCAVLGILYGTSQIASVSAAAQPVTGEMVYPIVYYAVTLACNCALLALGAGLFNRAAHDDLHGCVREWGIIAGNLVFLALTSVLLAAGGALAPWMLCLWALLALLSAAVLALTAVFLCRRAGQRTEKKK